MATDNIQIPLSSRDSGALAEDMMAGYILYDLMPSPYTVPLAKKARYLLASHVMPFSHIFDEITKGEMLSQEELDIITGFVIHADSMLSMTDGLLPEEVERVLDKVKAPLYEKIAATAGQNFVGKLDLHNS